MVGAIQSQFHNIRFHKWVQAVVTYEAHSRPVNANHIAYVSRASRCHKKSRLWERDRLIASGEVNGWVLVSLGGIHQPA